MCRSGQWDRAGRLVERRVRGAQRLRRAERRKRNRRLRIYRQSRRSPQRRIAFARGDGATLCIQCRARKHTWRTSGRLEERRPQQQCSREIHRNRDPHHVPTHHLDRRFWDWQLRIAGGIAQGLRSNPHEDFVQGAGKQWRNYSTIFKKNNYNPFLTIEIMHTFEVPDDVA